MISEGMKDRLSPLLDALQFRDNDSQEEESAHHKDIEVVRMIDRTSHISPIDRKKEQDWVITNPTDEIFNFVFLPLREFRRNLEVYDEDGTKLNYYPNRVVEELKTRAMGRDPESWSHFREKFKQYDYDLFIQLPREKPLRPGDYRTITLSFEQAEPVQFHKLWEPGWIRGWYEHWERKFFRIPKFRGDVERYPTHHHDVIIVVVGPPGYGTSGASNVEGGDPSGTLYKNGLDDDTRVVSCRLPPPESKRYDWDLEYNLIPNNRGLMVVLVYYYLLAVSIGGISLISYFLLPDMSNTGLLKAISGGFTTSTLGLIFALDADWTHRYKILSIVPLMLHGIAWVLWQFG